MKPLKQLRAPISGIVVDASACETDDLAYCGGIQVNLPGTWNWDDLVARAVASQWGGVAALSGIPGTVAEVVRRNAAAYGEAVADTVMSVRTWDLAHDEQRTFPLAECRFATGTSRLAELLPDGSERYEILDVSFLFKQGDLTAPIKDPVLTDLLGMQPDSRARLDQVRDAILAHTARMREPGHAVEPESDKRA